MNKFFLPRSTLAALLTIILLLAAQACTPALPAVVAPVGSASSDSGAVVEQPAEKAAKTEAAAPTSTPEPTPVPPTPTPPVEPLKITAQGFGMNEQTFWFAFIVENSNKNTAFERTRYTITAYDADSKVVFEKGDSYLGAIYPQQILGEVDQYRLDEGVKVARIEVELKGTTSKTTDQAAPLGTDQITLLPPNEKGVQVVRGLVTNQTEFVLDGLRTTVIAFNEAGDIIAGGSRNGVSVPGGGKVGVVLAYMSAEIPARIEVFPTLLKFHDAASPGENASNRPEEIIVLNKGYGLLKDEVSAYGLIVQNMSANDLKAQSDVRFYDPDGNLLTSSGQVFTIGPNQEMGIGGNFSIPEGAEIGKTEFEVWTIANQKNVTSQNYPAEPIAIPKAAGQSTILVEVTNPTDSKIEGWWPIWVVAFDEAGQIIGGGMGFLKNLEANSSGNYMVELSVSAAPAKVMAYATR